MNFKVFVEATIYESITMLTPLKGGLETFQQSIFQRSTLFVAESSFKVEVIE